jgi:Xaa-Pro aminopeptidase
MMDSSFFTNNRAVLGEKLQGGLVVMSAYAAMQRSNDLAHDFEQEANFWYLTGIELPGWLLIYDGQRNHATLVRPEMTEYERVFEGELSDDVLQKTSGADEIIEYKDFESCLRHSHRKHASVYALGKQDHGMTFTPNPAQKQLWATLERIFDRVLDCRDACIQQRAIKQPQELVIMQHAINVTAKAFAAARDAVRECRFEYQLQAVFSSEIERHGGSHAYAPIIASGENACVLHYSSNRDRMRTHQIVLCDVGARVGGYAADITRNFSIGEPTRRQREVHDRLLEAQQQIIRCVAPGLLIAEYQKQVDEIMHEALTQLGLGTHLSAEDAVRRYMPHAISHGLGIDVHDALGKPRLLEEGMVITVEPGIYIPEEHMGMRIEDDIVVTKTGHTTMSKKISTLL